MLTINNNNNNTNSNIKNEDILKLKQQQEISRNRNNLQQHHDEEDDEHEVIEDEDEDEEYSEINSESDNNTSTNSSSKDEEEEEDDDDEDEDDEEDNEQKRIRNHHNNLIRLNQKKKKRNNGSNLSILDLPFTILKEIYNYLDDDLDRISDPCGMSAVDTQASQSGALVQPADCTRHAARLAHPSPLVLGLLPSSLQHLKFGNKFCQQVWIDQLPPTIRSIEFGREFKQPHLTKSPLTHPIPTTITIIRKTVTYIDQSTLNSISTTTRIPLHC
ncbi:hypothetical protein DFA_10472 [Cavenderia fasciculata]|uniref:Uncharacterized protein n=1 Tax=Cavenderia fasciculata TaxID=261658 RepID=F4QAB1_CACFS|nr:uncharacterized protein DFA_10472 [Cavenderia fasciculata]EGG15630.1 hypothetical protein DFA_10472 [Cavenderia fasciculata]|eukprot:XP_004354372.1 hypothetical protein DFA_10472 [Cavenderia fasciculata]